MGRYVCTVPIRTALDIARFEPVPESVVALDVMLARGLVSAGDLAETVEALPPGRGTRRARVAVELSDGRAESPPETRLRVLLRSAGLTPQPQFVVRDRGGRTIARVDLAFPEQRVAIEYDGVWHADPASSRRTGGGSTGSFRRGGGYSTSRPRTCTTRPRSLRRFDGC